MEILAISIIILVIGLGFVISRKMLKHNMIRGNLYVQSQTTSKAIDELQRAEENEQEKRLLTNKYYRILREAMNREIAHYRSLPLAKVKELFIHSKVFKKEIEYNGQKLSLELFSDLNSNTSPALQLSIRPKSLWGFLFTIQEWVRY